MMVAAQQSIFPYSVVARSLQRKVEVFTRSIANHYKTFAFCPGQLIRWAARRYRHRGFVRARAFLHPEKVMASLD